MAGKIYLIHCKFCKKIFETEVENVWHSFAQAKVRGHCRNLKCEAKFKNLGKRENSYIADYYLHVRKEILAQKLNKNRVLFIKGNKLFRMDGSLIGPIKKTTKDKIIVQWPGESATLFKRIYVKRA